MPMVMSDAEILWANILSIGEHAIWGNCIHQASLGLHAWIETVEKVKFRRVYIVGCGTSYFAGQVGKYMIEHLTHLPVEAIQAFAFSLYTAPGLLDEQTLVVGVSTTGNTESVCRAVELARRLGAVTLAFTAGPDSLITQAAHTTILTGGRDTILVKTETYIQSLICLYLLGIRLANQLDWLNGESEEFWLEQIARAEKTTHAFFAQQQAEITRLVDRLKSADMIFVLGTGPNFGTAEEASLKISEMAKMYSVPKEMEEFYHGYEREFNDKCAMFFIAPKGPAFGRMLDFLTLNRKVGVPSIVITTEDGGTVNQLADHVVLLPGDLHELATPLVSIVPLYLFSYQLAVCRGWDPNARRFPGIVPLKVRYLG